VVYEDSSKAFYILKIALDDSNDRVVARGYIPGMAVQVGTWIGFEAEWTTHKEYGRQLAISKAPVLAQGWNAETAERILISNGVSEQLLKSIRTQIPNADDFLQILGDESGLALLPGINVFTAKYIVQRWHSAQTYYKALGFLNDLGLPAGKVREVWSTFGDQAEEVLSTNPWALVRIDGISFQQADEIANRMGLTESQHRVKGAVQYVVREQRSNGHLFLTTGQLFLGVQGIIPEVTKKSLAQAVAECHKAKELVIDRTTRSGTTAVYESWSYGIEKDSAELITRRLQTAGFGSTGLNTSNYAKRLGSTGLRTGKEAAKKRPKLEAVAKIAVEEWGELERLELSENQKKGVLNALTTPFSILTGLPGTGKTTSLRAVVRILQNAGVRFLLCAPTGIAAKNLTARTGAPAYTIHRAFAAKGISEETREFTYAGFIGGAAEAGSTNAPDKDTVWGYGSDNPHPAEVVIVDEASMLDQHLMYRLMSCTAPECRVVIVGDAAQLPSVGPGNVLRDMIASDRFPVVNLTEIFRQKDTSAIVYAAHAIHRGEVPECDPESDFGLVQVPSEEAVLTFIEQTAIDLYSRRENFQVLSPRHAGTVGVTNLNSRLRELLNPQGTGLMEIRLGDDTVRQDDRIMVVKNDYTLGVFNGDVGKVARIDRKAKEIEIKIFGEPPLHVCVPLKDASKLLRLAYCCTCHKCLVGDTLIHTSEGLIPLQDLVESGGASCIKRLSDAKFTVAGRHGWTDTDQVFVGDVEPTIKISTRHGYSVEGSHRHPILVLDEIHGYVWKKLPDVKLGDSVVIRKGVGNCVHCEVDTSGFVVDRGRGPVKRHGEIPLKIGSDLAWLMGVMLGDGDVTDAIDGYIRVFQKDRNFLQTVSDIAESQFGIKPVFGKGHVRWSGRMLRAFLVWCGIGFSKAPGKHVPWVVLRSPVEVQASFLRGLFDTDGSCTGGAIILTSSSSKMVYEVQQLLLGMGIVSRRHKVRDAVPSKKWAPYHRIEIYGASDRQRFQQMIGFTVPAKRDGLARSVAQGSRSKSNVGRVPNGQQLVIDLRAKLRARSGRNYPEAKLAGRLICHLAAGRPVRVNHLKVLAHIVPDLEHLSPELYSIMKEDLFFDPVVQIDSGEAQVFDLHVIAEDHSFVGNGIVNHNSQGLEYDVILMPLVDSFRHQLQRNLLYTAVTRARKRVILVGTYSALSAAVANDREDLRNTLFRDRISPSH